MLETVAALFVLFAEPGFPAVGVHQPLVEIPGATMVADASLLGDVLTPRHVLVWRHGSAYPAEAWPAIRQHLASGGSLLYLGGEPFTHAVVGEPGARVVQPRSVSVLKALRLNQCTRIDVPGATVRESGADGPERVLSEDAWVAVLQPRFSDTRDSAHEDGAPGARDAGLRTLSTVHAVGEDSRFPAAAGSVVISRWRGPFAGGQWVFRLTSDRVADAELRRLCGAALTPVTEVRVDPTYGCYHAGERPTLNVRVQRPRAMATMPGSIKIEVVAPDGSRWERLERLSGGRHATATIAVEGPTAPGLYRVSARWNDEPAVTTGYWIRDDALWRAGAPLSANRYTLLRDGEPLPFIGTTTMSATVHRKFLFEPNAAVWDDTFAELTALKVPVVRTGVWSAYRKIALDPQAVDEAWLRALEAYYLTARRHGVVVIFTFFAFVPESFGGDGPYFDPRAIEGQQAYLNTVATRFKDAPGIIWDLINEPSFASPDKLWKGRPHGDVHENAAFRAWLERRYTVAGSGRSWEDQVRSRWRLLPDDAIGVPSDDDFAERHVFGAHRPYRAKEYLHFANDAFIAWIAHMRQALREAGSTALVTVGQDEGGLQERPGPLFHHRAVDFTSMHTWWYNDAQLWDSVMAKAADKPLLITETGIMQRERLSGEPQRSPDDAAALLSRKIAYALAGGASAVIQWCYDVNPYMDSDNEVAIGLRRVDGSYKPEHRVWREYAAFLDRNRAAFVTPPAPDVVLIWPSGDHWPPRGVQTVATRRALDELMGNLRLSVQVVPEYRAADDLGSPRLIVLPACRGISDSAWTAIEQAVDRGAVLLCSGWFEADDAGHAARRLGVSRRTLARREVFGRVAATDLDARAVLHYPLDITESCWTVDRERLIERIDRGATGQIVHAAAPLEWSSTSPGRTRCYTYAAGLAGLTADRATIEADPGLFLRVIPLDEAYLIVAVNESSLAGQFKWNGQNGGHFSALKPGHAGLVLVASDGRLLDRCLP